MATIGYTTVGRGSGCCGHEHRTLRGAERCVDAHSKRHVSIWGEKSDRAIVSPTGIVVALPPAENRRGDVGWWRR